MKGSLAASSARARTEAAADGTRPERSTILSLPADGISAAIVRNGDFGTSPLFWAALGQAAASRYLITWGVGH